METAGGEGMGLGERVGWGFRQTQGHDHFGNRQSSGITLCHMSKFPSVIP